MDLKEFYEIWNRRHRECVSNNPDTRNDIMASWLEEQILKAKDAYYQSAQPIMDDNVYDKMEEYLKIINPNSPVLQKVGHTI